MTLREYVDGRRGVIAKLSREAGLDYKTVWLLVNDEEYRLNDYRKAKALSEATGGDVTIADLCEPEAA